LQEGYIAGMSKESSNVNRGQSVGRVQDRLSKRYEFEAKYLCDNDQTEPVRILFGRDCLTTTQLVPIFNLKEQKKKSSVGKGGKGGSMSQTEYYGGLAFSICAGEVEKLYRIYNADDLIYHSDGQSLISENDFCSIDISHNGTNYGTLRFYRGTETQDVDSAFNDLITLVPSNDSDTENINIIPANCTPAFKGICYFASDKFLYGTSNSVPNLRCEVEVKPKQLYTDLQLDEDEQEISILDDNGDTYIPLVIYEILRNTSWGGAGLSKDDIDLQSFVDSLKICFDEHNVVSPCIDSSTSIRDAISQCLEYVDGILVLNAENKITLKLIRNGDTVTPITKSDLIEEPRITWNTSSTWGVTKVSFCERINSYESTSEVFESPLYDRDQNFEAYKQEDFDLPWAKTRYVAAMLARRLGHAGALPDCDVKLTILPSSAVGLTCGSLISLTYEKVNVSGLILRVNEINYGSPDKPKVELKCVRQILTDWAIDSDVFSKYLSRLTKRDLVSPPGGWYTPRVLPVFHDEVNPLKKEPIGFYCFLSKNPNCPTTSLVYSYVHNEKDGNGTYNRRIEHDARVEIEGEVTSNFKGGYSVFGKINSISIVNNFYRIILDVDETNFEFYSELTGKGDLYIGTCAWRDNTRFWAPIYWKVESIATNESTHQLACDCTLNLKDTRDNPGNKNYYSIMPFVNGIFPSENAYLFLDGCLFAADSSLRYASSYKHNGLPFIDVIYAQAYFSDTKDLEDQTTAGRFVFARYIGGEIKTLSNNPDRTNLPYDEEGRENANYYDPLLVENLFNDAEKREDNFIDAWGNPVSLSAGSTVEWVTEAQVFISSDEDTGDTLIYCAADGNIYNSIGEVVDTFDNSAYIIVSDHAVSYPTNNSTITSISGRDNIIILHITEAGQSYTISGNAMEGDYLRIIVTADSEIEPNTPCTVYPPDGGSFTMTNGETVNSILLACGTTLELFCVWQDGSKVWLAVLSSNTKI